MKKVELQAVTSTKTAVTLSTVTVTMELLALVAVSVFAIQAVGTRSRDEQKSLFHITPPLIDCLISGKLLLSGPRR